MAWILVAAFVALIHLSSIVLGRFTRDRLQRLAFSSGLLGLFSFPAVLIFSFKSLCIAGACRSVDGTWLDASLALFVLLAVMSLLSSSALLARRFHS